MVAVHLPHGEGDANLGVVAFGAGDDAVVGREELHKPVFDDGFPVAAGDADDGDMELATVMGGQQLQSTYDVGDFP